MRAVKNILITGVGLVMISFLLLLVMQESLQKDGDSYLIEIPRSSYCEEKKDFLMDPWKVCEITGGSLLFQEGEGENEGDLVFFKRELTSNPFFFDFKKGVLGAATKTKIKPDSLDKLSVEVAEKYTSKCSSNGRFCVNENVKGFVKKKLEKGLVSDKEKLYGLVIFEVKDMQEGEVLFRRAKMKLGGSREEFAETFWSKDESYLLMSKDNELRYLKLK